jgi:hypothetical protein
MESLDVKNRRISKELETYDLVVIKHTLNLYDEKIEKVIDITSSLIQTRDKSFLKSNLRCVSNNQEQFYIFDYIPNNLVKFSSYLEKLDFKPIYGDRKRILNGTFNGYPVDILLDLRNTKNTHYVRVIIKLNNLIVYSGYLNDFELFKEVYESVINNNFKFI